MRCSSRRLTSYHLMMTLLILWSVLNALLLTCHVGHWQLESRLNHLLLLIFAADYLLRLIRTPDRKTFLIHSAFDLLGIIPMHPIFAVFRLGRLVRLALYHHLFWRLGLAGKWTHAFHRFLYGTGFIYLFSISIVIIVLSALLFSVSEHQSLADSLWWAVTTATTVGYGDDTPHTAVGKIVATGLMFGGIGFIGLLTSTITDFFTRQPAAQNSAPALSPDETRQLLQKLDHLTQQVDQLQTEVKRLAHQSATHHSK
ncbi:potassium channel family protein [Levilactobacillus suantsaii]|uniref:Two pore domain potassium channel family protein n=1 Tax=Levilactobacillus suantsaii TaxID=2292255 RepID=A0A4Q0VII8_9LACO|nr:potassium channel family protein [Levilactobacillus suantsaii]QMU07670.1 potassium channel family protein [Levilactobacillus suantsaii]RXI78651.1 two pore domain potassium channel family protein [Levilactobacillus suantsaii]